MIEKKGLVIVLILALILIGGTGCKPIKEQVYKTGLENYMENNDAVVARLLEKRIENQLEDGTNYDWNFESGNINVSIEKLKIKNDNMIHITNGKMRYDFTLSNESGTITKESQVIADLDVIMEERREFKEYYLIKVDGRAYTDNSAPEINNITYSSSNNQVTADLESITENVRATVFYKDSSYIYVDELNISRDSFDSTKATAAATMNIPADTPVSGIAAINLDEVEKDNDNLGIKIKFFDPKH